MKTRFFTHLVPLALALSGTLLLAACTRNANDPGAIPQATPTGEVANPTIDAGQSAQATQFSADATATAVANGGGGGIDLTATPVGGSGQLDVTPSTGTDMPQPVPTDTPAIINPTPETINPTPVPVSTEVVAASPLPPGVSCPNPYEVKQGDWIYKIARLCSVLPQDILAANPGVGNLIYPGQKLNMPTAGATAVKLCSGTYTVKSGDTLFRIAYTCGLTAEELAVANGITFPYVIKPGQVLKYP